MSKNFKGIVKNLSNEEYHSEQTHLSSSNYKTLLKDTEKFYKEKILGEKEQKTSNAFDEGSLAHAFILEPHLVDVEFAMFDGFRKAGKAWEDFKNSNPDKTLLSKPQWKRVEGWIDNYRKLPAATELLKGCDVELSLFGKFNNIPTKVRADAINIEEGYIVDVKTSGYDTDLESFKLTVDQFGYDLSAALYRKMYSDYFKKDFDFYFVVLGKKDNKCNVYKISKNTISKGNIQLAKACKIYRECIKSGDWTTKTKKLEVQCVDDYEILEV